VHENLANHYCPLAQYQAALKSGDDLGQYFFVRARNSMPAMAGRPGWLYRSWPDAEMM
jgi:hypothetical protein